MQLQEVTTRNIKLKKWHKVVIALSAVVVFITVYALTMPAVTKEGDTFCGYTEHTHTEACIGKTLVCGLEEGGHQHSEACRELGTEPVCGQEELVGHQHTMDCYTLESVLSCGLEPYAGHMHGDGCYTEEQYLVCADETHEHTEECYGTQSVLVCTVEESAGHAHSDTCYETQATQICGLEELVGHSHDTACYEWTGAYVCGQEEYEGHTHSEDCYVEGLICGMEEHTHSLACFADKNADVETPEIWERTVNSVELSGVWANDVVAIAKTQLGYSESTFNYIVENETEIYGYTRYGEWYGDPYGNWCAMFASFCLNYAGVDEQYVPFDKTCRNWVDNLTILEMYAAVGTYTPKAGDLIFFDNDSDLVANHVGIVMSVDSEQGTLVTIEGNFNNCVTEQTYYMNDARILGFGVLPENPNYVPSEVVPEEPAEETAPEENAEEVSGENGEEIAEEAAFSIEKTVEGADYTVTVSYGEEAQVPEEAELLVEEYAKDSETYLNRYNEAAAFYGWEAETDYTAGFRLFNIGLYVNGEEIVPAAQVLVKITYLNANEEETTLSYQVTHHGEATEGMSADSVDGEENTTISFVTGSFSDFGVFGMMAIVDTEETAQEEAEADPLTVTGEDFTVSVSAEEGIIPEGTVLTVSEYAKEDELYTQRLAELVETFEFNPEVDYSPFYRMFDLTLKVEDQIVEPLGAVTLTFTYTNVDAQDTDAVAAIHYGEEPEILDAAVELTEAGQVLTVETESFSDYAFLRMSEEDAIAAMEGSDAAAYVNLTNAPAAGQTLYGVQTDKLVEGEWYIIYGYGKDSQNKEVGYPLVASSSNFTIVDAAANGVNQKPNNTLPQAIYDTKGLDSVGIDGAGVVYSGSYDVLWQWDGKGFINRDGKYLCVEDDFLDNWGGAFWIGNIYVNGKSDYKVQYSSSHRVLYTTQWNYCKGNYIGPYYNKVYMQGWVQNGVGRVWGITEASMGPVQEKAYPIYLAQVTGMATAYATDAGTFSARASDFHPNTAITGTPASTDLVFYNFDATTGNVSPLAGVEYTITDSTGKIVGRYVTGSNYMVDIGKLSPGTYTIKQTKVPSGYQVVTQEKQFTVSKQGTAVIGSFYAYKPSDCHADKVGYVTDYGNRVYKVDISAYQHLYNYVINNIDMSLVVDQSNSMLFPAQLTSTGKTVTLYRNSNGRNESNLNNLRLDKNQLYFIIANESQTSTVYAIFYDSENKGWVFQDASFYAKAQNARDGIDLNSWEGDSPNQYQPRYASASAAYNQGVNNTDRNGKSGRPAAGGSIEKSFVGNDNYKNTLYSDLPANGGKTYTLYTGSTYNRLHELQQATMLLCNTLSSMSGNSKVLIEGFDKYPEFCKEFALGSDGSGVADVINAVNDIKTSGGTRQDRALDHLRNAYNGNTGHGTNHLTKGKNEYVVLITDGAPVASGTESVTLADVENAAQRVKNTGANLITIGLSMENVAGGSQMLINAASTKPNSSQKWNYASNSTGGLQQSIADVMFRIAGKEEYNSIATNVTDYISDSFYIVDQNQNPLKEGDMIDLNGNKITQVPRDGKYGTVQYDSAKGAWKVVWVNQYIQKNQEWVGSIYLKAKEDFMGGNTIDTNKTFYDEVNDKTVNGCTIQLKSTKNDQLDFAAFNPETPTVNVRLLPMDNANSVETVFLGDEVTDIEDKIKALYEQIDVKRIINCDKDVQCKPGVPGGVDLDLEYVLGQLTEDQWKQLMVGKSVRIEYTYDDASSHGPVGYFELTLTKEGDSSSFLDHKTTKTGVGVEKYTLKLDYVAYRITGGGDLDKREDDVHNGGKSPGTEVGTGKTLETGYGVSSTQCVHSVNVVDGKITVIKKLDEELKSDKETEYTFKLYKVEDTVETEINLMADGSNYKPLTSGGTQVPLKVKVSANKLQGSTSIVDLPRGIYKLVESYSDDYQVDKDNTKIDASGTNCYTAEAENNNGEKCLYFHIGCDLNDNDVIVAGTQDFPDTKVYTQLSTGTPTKDAQCKAVSYGTGIVTNKAPENFGYIPVEKTWADVSAIQDVYAILYLDGQPYTIKDEQQALILSQDNGWQGVFKIPLKKGESVNDYNFSVLELSGVQEYKGGEYSSDYTKARVVNLGDDDNPVYILYEKALSEGIVKVGDIGYAVTITKVKVTDQSRCWWVPPPYCPPPTPPTPPDPPEEETYIFNITNSPAYELPKAGGMGTDIFMIGGFCLMGAALIYGVTTLRKREERSE